MPRQCDTCGKSKGKRQFSTAGWANADNGDGKCRSCVRSEAVAAATIGTGGNEITIKVGRRVKLCGIIKRPELNDTYGYTERFDVEKQRYMVTSFFAKITIALKPVNVRDEIYSADYLTTTLRHAAAIMRLVERAPLNARKVPFLEQCSITNFNVVQARVGGEGANQDDDDFADDEDEVLQNVVHHMMMVDESGGDALCNLFGRGLGQHMYGLYTSPGQGDKVTIKKSKTWVPPPLFEKRRALDESLAADITAALATTTQLFRELLKEGQLPPTGRIAVGSSVQIDGLKSKPELNGMRCIVRAEKDGRWVVKLCSMRLDMPLALKPENLVDPSDPNPFCYTPKGMTVTADLQKALAPLFANIPFSRPARPLRKLIAQGLSKLGGITAMRLWFRFIELNGTAGLAWEEEDAAGKDEWIADLCNLQQIASMIAHFNKGWRRSPDALWIESMAHLLRGGGTEAAYLASQALAHDADRWSTDSFRVFAKQTLQWTRDLNSSKSYPTLGRWRCISNSEGAKGVPRDGNAPENACGAATCQVGETLYLFGGLCNPKAGETNFHLRHYLKMLHYHTGNATKEICNDTLFSLHLPTNTWTKRENIKGKSCPSGRAFAMLESQEDGFLWLYGGRTSWSCWMNQAGGAELLNDMWRYEIAADRWTWVRGRGHPKIQGSGPYASVPGYLFVVDPVCVHGDYSDSEPAVLRRYNIKKGLWDTPPKKTVQNAPAIRAEACGWCHGGRLYVWTLGKTPGGFNQMCIQSVKLEGTDWGTWKVHYQRLAPAGQKHLQADCLGGQVAGLWQECAASMDPKTEKVYLFGGWNGDNYSFAYLPGNACPSSTSFL